MDILEMVTEEDYPTLHKLVNENDARFDEPPFNRRKYNLKII